MSNADSKFVSGTYLLGKFAGLTGTLGPALYEQSLNFSAI